jgi:lantibiotic biosynthesis protein
MRESFFREFGGSKGLQFQIDRRLRDERRALMPLLDPERDTESEIAPALAILRRRSERMAPHLAELRRREQAGLLNAPLGAQAGSYVHMFVNRMIRGAARAHEMVLYDFLHQLHVSRAARLRKGKGGKKGD